MVYPNGRIPLEALTPIGDGLFMEHKAAVAWISARADVFAETGIMPVVSTPDGAYRDYAGQVRQKALAVADGDPMRAATPGYSTHGEGLSVDVWNISRYNLAQLERIMARHGFRRNIPYESWHFTHDGTTTAGTTGTQIEENDMADITREQMQQIAIVLLDTNIATAVGTRSVKQALSDALLFGKATADGIRHIPVSVWGHGLNRPDATNPDGTPKITSAGDLLRYEPAEHTNTRTAISGSNGAEVDVAAILAVLKALPAEKVAALKAAL